MNRTVLITGATSGIGEATALVFALDGWNVLITYHSDEQKADYVVRECLDRGASGSKSFHLDLTDEGSIRAFHKKISVGFDVINVLINNAGYCADGTLANSSFDEIDRQIETNLSGPIKLTMLLVPHISEQIINVSSQYGKEALPGYTTYCASKWGLRGFTKSLAKELPDVKCVSINPGPVRTKMNGFFEGGVEPTEVAEIISKVVNEKIDVGTGGDVDVWKMVERKKKTKKKKGCLRKREH